MATNCPNLFTDWAYPQGVRVSGTHTGQACGVTQVTRESRGGHFKSNGQEISTMEWKINNYCLQILSINSFYVAK